MVRTRRMAREAAGQSGDLAAAESQPDVPASQTRKKRAGSGSGDQVLDSTACDKGKRKKLWNDATENLFCKCYVEALRSQDWRTLTCEVKFMKIAEAIQFKSGKSFTQDQLKSKAAKLKALYMEYRFPPERPRTAAFWHKKERIDVGYRRIKNGKAPLNFDLLKEIFETEESTEEVEKKRKLAEEDATELKQEVEVMARAIEEAKQTEAELIAKAQKLEHLIAQSEQRVEEVEGEYQNRHDLLLVSTKRVEEVKAENHKLFETLQELKGNIRVFCRVRPSLPGQDPASTTVSFFSDYGELCVSSKIKGKKLFKFNRVFGPRASQVDVFSEIKPLMRSVLDGFDICIFAYGQTGSGKTYTMSGPSSSKDDCGVISRALRELFDIAQRRTIFTYKVKVQMLEIYNEEVYDLLTTKRRPLKIFNSMVQDARLYEVSSTSDVLMRMHQGQANRAVASTALNESSSRSHSILIVHVSGQDLNNGSTVRSCLTFIDLAGSERVEKSQVTGTRLKEAANINTSLMELGKVITALAQKSAFVPYRNSKLTELLQRSLGGRAKTLMLVHIAPEPEFYDETVNTLKFAQNASRVELGAAQRQRQLHESKSAHLPRSSCSHVLLSPAWGLGSSQLAGGSTMAQEDPVVSAQWLQQHLGLPDVKVLDASWYMPEENRDPWQEYQVAHIPGSLFFDIDGIVDRTTDLPHMLPSQEAFAAAVSALGIKNQDNVIVYDGKGFFSAPRVWWMFRVFGHNNVWVLDGGLPQWRAAGFDLGSDSNDDAILKSKAANNAVETVEL